MSNEIDKLTINFNIEVYEEEGDIWIRQDHSDEIDSVIIPPRFLGEVIDHLQHLQNKLVEVDE